MNRLCITYNPEYGNFVFSRGKITTTVAKIVIIIIFTSSDDIQPSTL